MVIEGWMVDVALGIISALLIWRGWSKGFIHTAGSLIVLVVSLVTTGWIFWEAQTRFGVALSGLSPWMLIGGYVLLSFVISQLLMFIVRIIDLARRLLSLLPFIGIMNSFFGAMVGAAQAVALIAALTFVSISYLPSGEVRRLILESQAVQFVASVEQEVGMLILE